MEKQKGKYVSTVARGSALIDEMRILIDRFEPDLDINKWVDKVVEENVLGKASRDWTKEIIRRYFLSRYVNSEPPDVWKFLKTLSSKNVDTSIIRPIMYYHTVKSDIFLYDFVVFDLFERYYSGQRYISANDVKEFIRTSERDRFESEWSDYVKGRLSRGVMANLRDFGILEGKAKKTIADFYLPPEVFVYVAFLIYSVVSSGELVINHNDWKLFLLQPLNVERMFLEADQNGYLKYDAAGKLIRIEFNYKTAEELVNEIASRAY